MRVTAKPSRSTRDIELQVESAPLTEAHPAREPRAARPPAPPRATASGWRAGLVLSVLVALVLAVATTVLLAQRGTAPGASPSAPSHAAGGTTIVLIILPIGLALIGGLAAALWVLGRRRSRRGPLRRPDRDTPPDHRGSPGRPHASLGTPDVLVLTESATEGDPRLRERVKNHENAVFANLQLACSFYPTEDWAFSGARLTVVLAREDGRAAPAPIAYSLLPLSDEDGSAHERSVEIGADMKFVTLKGGERSTVSGDVFLRGYGLQESVSYWEFTATQSRPLQGSFLLWLIARAPRETNLVVTSSLDVRVAPRRVWSRADAPTVTGTGEVQLLLGIKDGPPYTARLGGSAPDVDRVPWPVDAR